MLEYFIYCRGIVFQYILASDGDDIFVQDLTYIAKFIKE